MNSETCRTSLIYVVMIRNFYDTALVVELHIPSGIIDVHELTITQHYIITILVQLSFSNQAEDETTKLISPYSSTFLKSFKV